MTVPNEKFQSVLDSVGENPELKTGFQLNTLKLRCEELIFLAKTLTEVRQVIPLIEKGIQRAKESEATEGVGREYGDNFWTDRRIDFQDLIANCFRLIGLKRLPEK